MKIGIGNIAEVANKYTLRDFDSWLWLDANFDEGDGTVLIFEANSPDPQDIWYFNAGTPCTMTDVITDEWCVFTVPDRDGTMHRFRAYIEADLRK